jgi:putative YhdH/YhfP family quinone oxidoreductase
MDKFKAFRIREAGGKTEAGFTDYTLDELDPGDVVVRVSHSTINYKDALAATGKGRILQRPQCIGGVDLAGTVVSSSDPRFKPGQGVLATGHALGVKHDGGYAEYARLPGDWVHALPPGITAWDAMALGTAGFTAAFAIMRMEHNGLAPKNGAVIVDGATGGVGSVAIAALARLGYEVVALTGKESEADFLRGLGAKEVKLRGELDLKKIRPLDRATYAGAVDNLGGEVLSWMLSSMKFGGTVAAIGLAASPALNTTVMPFILRGVSLLGINSTDVPTRGEHEEVWRRLSTDMRPPQLASMARTIPFEALPSAFDDFIASRVKGRVVVGIGEKR